MRRRTSHDHDHHLFMTANQDTMISALLAAKKAKGMSFADLGAKLGRDEVWVASLFYLQATASADEA